MGIMRCLVANVAETEEEILFFEEDKEGKKEEGIDTESRGKENG
jgi:hypothetical protein